MAARFPSLSPDASVSSDEDGELLTTSTPIAGLDTMFQARSAPSTPTPQPSQDMPMPSSGPVMSSPIIGTQKERAIHRRAKAVEKKKREREALAAQEVLQAEEKMLSDLQEVHQFLKSKGLRFGQYLRFVSDPQGKQGAIRWQEFFQHKGEAEQILDWWALTQTSDEARGEVREWAVKFVAQLVAAEAREVTKSKVLQTAGKVVDEEMIDDFSYAKLHDKLREAAPTAMKMLEAFSTSRYSSTKHTDRRKAQTQTVITSTALACLGEYSHSNNLSKRMMALFLYATGAQRQTISSISSLGLSESYTNLITKNERRQRKKKAPEVSTVITDSDPTASASTSAQPTIVPSPTVPGSRYTGTLRQLSESMRAKARTLAAHGLYSTVYDNINMMFRNAEQTVARHDSQENGTCATVVPLWAANLKDLKVENYQTRFLEARKLQLMDILPTETEAKSLKHHLIYTILRIIVKHGGEGFKKFESDLEKNQPYTKDKIMKHTTNLYPLTTWNIDEASISGNIEVQSAILKELQLDKDPDFWKRLRFFGGDQLSLARFRAIEIIRAGQEHGHNAFFGSTWIPGLFHGKMADATGTLFTHWGKPDIGAQNPGSLWFHNTTLNRLPVTLSSLPSFRTCRDLIFVSLYARVLHCLVIVGGEKVDSLETYLVKFGSWESLVKHAEEIYDRFSQISVVEDLRKERVRAERKATDEQPAEKAGDMVFENAVLFMRDALISREFSDAVKAGDSGRVVLVLKTWALSFRGNGRTKYAYEMLHLIHNLTTVWSEEIRKIVMNNWLVNPSGLENSWVEIDLMQEHLNSWIKVFYKAHGANATWDWLEWISPCVNVLRKLAKSFHDILGSDQGTRHAPADLTDDIRALMNSLEMYEIYQIKKGRDFHNVDEPVVDVITKGLEGLCDGTKNPISEYNEAFDRLQTRRRMKPVIPEALAAAVANEMPPKLTSLPPPTSPSSQDMINPSPLATPTHNTDHDGVEGDDEVETVVNYLDDWEHGADDPEVMVSVQGAADVELDMDEVVVEIERTTTRAT